jgi:transposase
VRLWRNARELTKLGHEVRLMQPSYVKGVAPRTSYVKGYVKRGKTDKADAEARLRSGVAAIHALRSCEKRRPASPADDPRRTKGAPLAQRPGVSRPPADPRAVNAIRAHLGAFGIVTPEACLRHDAKGIHSEAGKTSIQ